jgi:hypothetical protein
VVPVTDIEEPDAPTLDATVVGDDVRLGEAVDLVIYRDREARARMEEVNVHVEMLRAILDEDTWGLFLRYDERANGRFSELALVIAKWAFTEGQRFPLPNTEPSS